MNTIEISKYFCKLLKSNVSLICSNYGDINPNYFNAMKYQHIIGSVISNFQKDQLCQKSIHYIEGYEKVIFFHFISGDLISIQFIKNSTLRTFPVFIYSPKITGLFMMFYDSSEPDLIMSSVSINNQKTMFFGTYYDQYGIHSMHGLYSDLQKNKLRDYFDFFCLYDLIESLCPIHKPFLQLRNYEKKY